MPVSANFKRPFQNFVQKAHKPLQLAIADGVDLVCENPQAGEAKVGDLAGIYVYKFRFQNQQYLIAYQPPQEDRIENAEVEFLVIDFYKVGGHENFYEELKRYLKEES